VINDVSHDNWPDKWAQILRTINHDLRTINHDLSP